MRKLIAASVIALATGMSGGAFAEPVKVGLITTLSGGGAGLGIDARDGFLLALKNAGDAASEIEVVTEDDGQKPELAVQIADKMIQSDQVDILTGIIWSNLAMAVVPSAVAPRRLPPPSATRTISTSPTRTTISTRRWASTPTRPTRRPSSWPPTIRRARMR
jgi:branched-chain amino acid transport system substrate-binding protein